MLERFVLGSAVFFGRDAASLRLALMRSSTLQSGMDLSRMQCGINCVS